MIAIHDRVRLARRHARISQSSLAREVGVSRGAVAQWERPDGAVPTMTNLIKISVVGRVNVEWLATGRGPMAVKADDAPDQLTALQLSEFALSDEEQRMLRAARCLDRGTLLAILSLAEALAATKRRSPSDVAGAGASVEANGVDARLRSFESL